MRVAFLFFRRVVSTRQYFTNVLPCPVQPRRHGTGRAFHNGGYGSVIQLLLVSKQEDRTIEGVELVQSLIDVQCRDKLILNNLAIWRRYVEVRVEPQSPFATKELKCFVDRNSIQPRCQGRFPIELRYPGEGSDVRVLSQVEGHVFAPRHPQQDPINPGRSLLIELALGLPVRVPTSLHKL